MSVRPTSPVPQGIYQDEWKTGCALRQARSAAAATLLLALGLIAGCAGGDFGAELSTRPRPRALGSETRTALQLPADEKFSIVFSPASQAPGLGGTAEARASAKPDGNAEVSAAVTTAGTAEAQFQLGHVFSNESETQADLDVSVRFHYRLHSEGSPEAGIADASVGLKLFATGTRNQTLKTIDLVNHTTIAGGESRESDEHVQFRLTLGPRQLASVYLAGQARASIESERSAAGALEVRGLQMSVKLVPAPPVRSASDASVPPPADAAPPANPAREE